MKQFRVLDHTADIGLVIYGTDLKSLFEHAGKAFFHLITDLRRVRPRVEKKISLHGEGLERLMVSWLTELLYYHDVENLLFRRFKVDSVRAGGTAGSGIWGTFSRRSSCHQDRDQGSDVPSNSRRKRKRDVEGSDDPRSLTGKSAACPAFLPADRGGELHWVFLPRSFLYVRSNGYGR